MKVSRAEVMKNRKRILASAARLFRQRGLDGVSVAQIMVSVGLTHGAFYGYFKSKEDLVAQMLTALLLPGPEGSSEVPDDFSTYASAYLSEKHRNDPAGGCPYAALGSEIVRAPKAVRTVMTKAVTHRIQKLSASAPGATAAKKRRSAIAGWSAMIGAVLLSRIVDDPRLSDEILKETYATLKH
jgi:TetR/AcrR family transcriptional regulator, transcriptional repressor for nem operon